MRYSLLEYLQEAQALRGLGGCFCLWIRLVFFLYLDLLVQNGLQRLGSGLSLHFKELSVCRVLGEPVFLLDRDEDGPAVYSQASHVFAFYFLSDAVLHSLAVSPVLPGLGPSAVVRLANLELALVPLCDRFPLNRVATRHFAEVAPGVFAELVGPEASDLSQLVLGRGV